MYVDLGAEKLIAAQKDQQKIAVEIKSFLRVSITSEFHTALGQYLNYQLILENKEADRILYLAVSKDTYTTFFSLLFTQKAIKKYRVNIIVYDPDEEVIIEWKN